MDRQIYWAARHRSSLHRDMLCVIVDTFDRAQSYPCQNTLMAEFQKEQCTRCTWEPCLGTKYLRAFIFPESAVNLLYMFSASHLRSLCAIDCSHGSWTRVLYVLITPRGYGMWIKLELGMRNLDALGIIRWICMHMKMLRQSSQRNFLLWFILNLVTLRSCGLWKRFGYAAGPGMLHTHQRFLDCLGLKKSKSSRTWRSKKRYFETFKALWVD